MTAATKRALHAAYGRVLVLTLDGGIRWMVVNYDEALKKPVLGSRGSFC
ncbi:MAG: hypothetical protein K1X78_08185 [Verrucomicrobiaceae bacterium]|nr:hypothetical protein [Verrucomicrobiaceae bacterium]